MMTQLELQQIRKYGEDYTTVSNIRKFKAYDVLDRVYNGFIKHETFTNYDYRLKRSAYSMKYDGKQQAVYFLYDKGDLVYIGQTVRENPYVRSQEHLKCRRKPKVYDTVKIMMIPEDVCIDTLESELIVKLTPKYNDTWRGIPISRKRLKAIQKYRNQFNLKIN